MSTPKKSSETIIMFPIFAEILRKIRKALGLGQEDMAHALSVHHQTYSRYEGGEMVPGASLIFRLYNLGVSPGFILTGRGDILMGNDQKLVTDHGPMHSHESATVRFLKDQTGERMASVLIEVILPWLEKHFGPSVFQGKMDGWIMDSDNMSPNILKGEFLIIDTSIIDVRGSGIYVFRENDRLFVRRIHERLDGTIYVCSDNPVYNDSNFQIDRERFQERLVSGTTAKGLFLVGKIVRVLKEA